MFSARERRDALQALLDSPGWAILCGIVQDQVKARTDSIILIPLESQDAVLSQEFAKGEVAFARTLLVLPATQVEVLNDELSLTAENADDGETEEFDDDDA